MTESPVCTINLKNDTDFALTFAETSPEDPQTVHLPAKTPSGPGTGKITVTDKVKGDIEVVACSAVLGCAANQSSATAGNQATFDVDPSKGTVHSTFGDQSPSPARQFKATIKNTGSEKTIFYFLGMYTTYEEGSVTPRTMITMTLDDVDGYLKAVFSMRDYGTSGGSFVHFPWTDKSKSITKTVTARQELQGGFTNVVLTLV